MLALGAGGSALLTMFVGVLAGGLAPLEALGAAAGCTLAMGFVLCLTLPLMFRLPVERARVFMTLAMIVPTLLIVTLTQVTDVPLTTLERAPWPLLLAGWRAAGRVQPFPIASPCGSCSTGPVAKDGWRVRPTCATMTAGRLASAAGGGRHVHFEEGRAGVV